MKGIRTTLYTILFFFLSFFLSTTSKAACWLWGNECGYLFSHFESATAYPKATTAQGGANSYDDPQIGVRIRRCSNCTYDDYDLTLKLGEIKTPTGSPSVYRYHAEIRTHEKTCKNKCAYASGCDNKILQIDPIKKHCHSIANWPLCDPQVSSLTLNMCDRSAKITPEKPAATTGICVYKSDYTGYEQWFVDAWNCIKDLGQRIFCPSCSIDDEWSNKRVVPEPKDWSLLDCYPVPSAPLPYPFCKFPIKVYSPLTVLRMCEVGETPYRTLSGSTEECVYPAPATPNMQSTFMNPCARITYDNPVGNSSIAGNTTHNDLYNIDYTKYYTGQGTNLELLYNNLSLNNKVRFSTVYDDNKDNGTTIPLSLFGYNNANYIDICGAINPSDGSISISGSNTFTDQHGNKRTLKLSICKDTVTGENTCRPNSSDIFTKKEVCVFEVMDGKEIFQKCVKRPKMPKPSVSLCDNVFNDKTNSCMNVEALKQNYQFKGNTTSCTYSGSAPPELCTLQNSTPQNLFGFRPILTNRCYVNAISIDQHDKANKYICYKNEPTCQTQRETSGDCSKCNVNEYCAELDTSTPPIPFAKKIVGGERICLDGYTDAYTELSQPWCKDGTTKPCNRVCANYYQTADHQMNAYLDVGSRTMPIPKTASPLEPPSCAYARPITPRDQAQYRVRNPIEEGLCVDAYTIKFNKECMPQKEDLYFNKDLCSKIKSFCSKTDNLKQHYTNFDECQAMFKTCLGSAPPKEKQKLSDGTIYSCEDIQTFATTSDTFKKAKPPLEPIKPTK